MDIHFEPDTLNAQQIHFEPDPVAHLQAAQGEALASPQELMQMFKDSKTARVYNTMASPIKALGNAINSGNQQLGQAMQTGLGNPNNPSPMPMAAQAIGKAYQKVSPYLNPVPTNDVGLAMFPAVAAEGAAALAGRGKQLAGGASDIVNQLLGTAGDEAAAGPGAQKLAQATKMQKAMATALSSANRVKPNELAAVLANPEIMSESTPSVRDVNKMYADAFDEAGMKIDDARYKYLTGLTRPLRDQEVGKAGKIVDMALDPTNPAKLRPGLQETEAFIARTAASKLARSVPAASNPAYKAAAEKQMAMFDDMLENSSLPQIRQLSRLRFMAQVKENMLEPIPLNKQGTPNALSTLLAAAQMRRGLEQIGNGQPVRGVANIGAGAMFSPLVGGKVIGAANMAGNNIGALSALGNNAVSGDPGAQQ